MIYGHQCLHASWSSAAMLIVTVVALAGCSVTGLDNASDRFHCNAPKGVPCSSTSGVYANSVAGTLPPTKATPQEESVAPETLERIDAARGVASALTHSFNGVSRRVVPGAGQAIRSLPKQLRVLIFPWVDADNDLHDQSYVYMAVDPGRWLIEHTRAVIRNDAPAPRLMNVPNDVPPTGQSMREEADDPAASARAGSDRPPTIVIPRAGIAPNVARGVGVPGLFERPLYGTPQAPGAAASAQRPHVDAADSDTLED